jgi:hypothetical protein
VWRISLRLNRDRSIVNRGSVIVRGAQRRWPVGGLSSLTSFLCEGRLMITSGPKKRRAGTRQLLDDLKELKG